MIEFWIETALECFNTGNFNSLMAILSALNMNAVTRLKKSVSFNLIYRYQCVSNRLIVVVQSAKDETRRLRTPNGSQL